MQTKIHLRTGTLICVFAIFLAHDNSTHLMIQTNYYAASTTGRHFTKKKSTFNKQTVYYRVHQGG